MQSSLKFHASQMQIPSAVLTSLHSLILDNRNLTQILEQHQSKDKSWQKTRCDHGLSHLEIVVSGFPAI